jgi:hypothetical protein
MRVYAVYRLSGAQATVYSTGNARRALRVKMHIERRLCRIPSIATGFFLTISDISSRPKLVKSLPVVIMSSVCPLSVSLWSIPLPLTIQTTRRVYRLSYCNELMTRILLALWQRLKLTVSGCQGGKKVITLERKVVSACAKSKGSRQTSK